MNLKNTAVKFLQMVVSGRIDEAYEKYVDMTGKHHNIYFPAGFAVLKEVMKENHKQFPAKVFEIKKVVAENDMVFTHSKIILGDKEIAVVHIFRFEKGKIAEMWDIGHEIPKELSNKDGVF